MLALVLVWSRDELERIGELALLPPIAGAHVLGRGGDLSPGQVLTELVRQRPGANEGTGPLASPLLSRAHLVIRADADALELQNVGRAPLLINGLAGEIDARPAHHEGQRRYLAHMLTDGAALLTLLGRDLGHARALAEQLSHALQAPAAVERGL